ncbi:hypothetical protein CDD81_5562 [Ophiocordyceps australis]|uniref:SUN domain-containing protein n=1 Tax=Ophiocordyceps australis TaxID=1399860 RepID=A0A2C5Y8C1_9HYPO|nr:hypothetical protein CDD81_5562 [Ophiocordyceps australis]
MKAFVTYSLAAILAVPATAHSHNHLHRHAKKHAASRVQRRQPDAVTEVVSATQVLFELDGKLLDPEQAQSGLQNGKYVVVSESVSNKEVPPSPPVQPVPEAAPQNAPEPSVQPPPEPVPSKPPPKDVADNNPPAGGQFIEKPPIKADPQSSSEDKDRDSTPKSPQPEPRPRPESLRMPSTETNQVDSSYSTAGINAKFPSGKIPCSEFPSKYGALALNHLNTGGWAGLQFDAEYSMASKSVSNIVTGIPGQTCTKGYFCSYACPPGYQKTQWPEAQGSKGESVGGLYCNSEGLLELTREGSDTLCEEGAGGVSIKNNLNEVVSACRTDYPGTESMVIPAIAEPGQEINLTNPLQDSYYQAGKASGQGKPTSAQYYVNKKGLGIREACVWVSSPGLESEAGNWSPMILGVGKAKDGITYISLFENTQTSKAKLDFNIKISGDVEAECRYENGEWHGGPNGCTTALKSGHATVVYY